MGTARGSPSVSVGTCIRSDFIFTWCFTYYNEAYGGNLQLPAYQKRSTVSVINMEDNNLK